MTYNYQGDGVEKFITVTKTRKCLAAMTFLAMAACTPAEKAPAFDFEAATQAERQAWLQPRAEQTSKGYVKGLNRNGLTLYSEEPVQVNTIGRQVVVTARLNSNMARVNIDSNQKRQLERAVCKDYVRSEYYAANIMIVNRILENNKREALRITQTPEFCDNMVK